MNIKQSRFLSRRCSKQILDREQKKLAPINAESYRTLNREHVGHSRRNGGRTVKLTHRDSADYASTHCGVLYCK
ncbi:hypothetical protein GWI33_005090 [Rhynchophorus ferrugineus]|uniref:Uncharacterized protein n=1 Tax=Rhynchophorus ferrugineus TaxID=354439 RepID=A0A834IWE4_RHYFE|nr:hypothetical protein GWI33_005090 [Rhynchophorus ferrugineus]